MKKMKLIVLLVIITYSNITLAQHDVNKAIAERQALHRFFNNYAVKIEDAICKLNYPWEYTKVWYAFGFPKESISFLMRYIVEDAKFLYKIENLKDPKQLCEIIQAKVFEVAFIFHTYTSKNQYRKLEHLFWSDSEHFVLFANPDFNRWYHDLHKKLFLSFWKSMSDRAALTYTLVRNLVKNKCGDYTYDHACELKKNEDMFSNSFGTNEMAGPASMVGSNPISWGAVLRWIAQQAVFGYLHYAVGEVINNFDSFIEGSYYIESNYMGFPFYIYEF